MSFEKNRVFSLFLPSWNHWERKREVEIIWDLSLFFFLLFFGKGSRALEIRQLTKYSQYCLHIILSE